MSLGLFFGLRASGYRSLRSYDQSLAPPLKRQIAHPWATDARTLAAREPQGPPASLRSAFARPVRKEIGNPWLHW